MYKLTINIFGGEPTSVQRLSDGAFIPFNLGNMDYQIYLKWLDGYEIVNGELTKTSEGNTPLPPDIQTE